MAFVLLLAPALVCGRVMITPNSTNEPDKIYGVNLGGWLMMEPWIAPKLFQKANEGVARQSDNSFSIVDEYTWRSAGNGTYDRRELIVDHWKTFFTKDMLQDLADGGITHLRIPMGYWYFASFDDPFSQWDDLYPTALECLKTLVNEWCKETGLKALFDLHGAPGSENGFDNSGRRGDIHVLDDPNYTNFLTALANMSKWVIENIDSDRIFGIEVVNEPAGYNDWMWTAINEKINPDGYKAIRKADSEVNVIFQTGFKLPHDQSNWPEPDYHNVWFDDHNYQCFGDDWNSMATQEGDGWSQHLQHSCDMASDYQNTFLWTFVGEWSLAVSDCTIFLDGGVNGGCDMAADPDCVYRGWPEQNGSPSTCEYYNQPADKMADNYKDFLNKFARAQMEAFENGVGWFFWTAHTEDNHAPEWDYLLGLKEGWIPKISEREPYCS